MTAAADQSADAAQMGPVDYLVVAFPTDRMTGEAFRLLVDLVDRGIIRILDLAFVRKDLDGAVTTLSQLDVERMQVLDAALFDGAASGLLDETDLSEAAAALDPGTAAAVLVYENVWAAPFAIALRRVGGQLVAYGHIPVQALLATLDALETEEEDAPTGAIPAQSSGERAPSQTVG
jgi:Family of unknown function (DUF6325)